MIDKQLKDRGIKDSRVLRAMEEVPRHLFVPKEVEPYAYEDYPLPIGFKQTISQPYIVAFMTEVARIKPADRVLDVGTGSGYQAAILSKLAKEVYSIEIIAPLGESAAERLKRLGYQGVEVRVGDGYKGWPEKAPFDVILVAASPEHVPSPLMDQLRIGGRLIIPVGSDLQELVRITKTKDGFHRETLLPVRFVPMTGIVEGLPIKSTK